MYTSFVITRVTYTLHTLLLFSSPLSTFIHLKVFLFSVIYSLAKELIKKLIDWKGQCFILIKIGKTAMKCNASGIQCSRIIQSGMVNKFALSIRNGNVATCNMQTDDGHINVCASLSANR